MMCFFSFWVTSSNFSENALSLGRSSRSCLINDSFALHLEHMD
jgi:hypothetical protein